MDLKCLCLNVTLSVQQQTFGRPLDHEALRQEDQRDPLAGCCLREMDLDSAGMSLEMSCLVSEVLYGDLLVHTCHGCKMVTHAAHQHKLGRLFVNEELIHDESTIDDLRQSANFSQVFRIVLPPEYDTSFPDVMKLRKSLGNSVKQAQQEMDTYLMSEEAAVQAKIRAFADEQNTALTRIKQKAQQDLRALYSIMQDIPVNDKTGQKTESRAVAPGLYHVSTERPANISIFPTEHTLNRPAEVPVRDIGVFSMDDLEDHDREQPACVSEDEDDDPSTDNSFQGSQSGIDMAKRAAASSRSDGSAWLLGKSAPVRMPGRIPGEFDLSSFQEDTTPSFAEMGNSIKAIAQSVQDQSVLVFGELPRPRTATSFIDSVSWCVVFSVVILCTSHFCVPCYWPLPRIW